MTCAPLVSVLCAAVLFQTTWAGPVQGGGCEPSWVPTFDGHLNVDGHVAALAAFDDGSGPALYVGGDFSRIGGVEAHNIARWDGTSWSSVGGGLGDSSVFFSQVFALAVFDDGTGPALYAGGSFTGGGSPAYIARWDGSSWTPLGSGVNLHVYALTVFDAGDGPALYAGGEFTSAGGSTARRIAKWDGTTWSRLDSLMNEGAVHALAAFDDGSGPALYAGGSFVSAGGFTADHLARWDGSTWTAVGGGTNAQVSALAVFDGGSGPALYAGGRFTTAGGVAANHVASWDGTSWAPLGNGMNGWVNALAVYDDGSGPALYSGSDGAPHYIARWNGASWSPLHGGMNDSVLAFAAFDDGSGPALFAGGSFSVAGGEVAHRIARWRNSSWAALNGPGNSVLPWVNCLTVHDDGSGPALHAGGYFATAGDVEANRIAKWDGSSWSALGSGVSGYVEDLAVFDDGNGPALYAGGGFTTAGGAAANYVAKWDGSAWSALGSGMGGGPSFTNVDALAVYDDGAGPALYAGGRFTTAGGVSANYIAKWDGDAWSPVGGGMNHVVACLEVFDDGSGPALFAGGLFTIAGSVSGRYIARWDGSSWSATHCGMFGSSNTAVLALAVFDDGGGPALYAGGRFRDAGCVTVNGIAKWDGSFWTPLGDGFSDDIFALSAFDDGSGPALYAGGRFSNASGVPASLIARWDGSSWSAVGSGMSGALVTSLQVFDDGQGPALFAGGSFTALDSGDVHLARWAANDTAPPTLSTPSAVAVTDEWGGSPGELVTFTVTAADACDSSPSVVCVPPSGSFFPRGTTFVTCTATDAAGNQSTHAFPVSVAPPPRRR